MNNGKKEIARRTTMVISAIKQSLNEGDSTVLLFASHHLQDLDADYWKKHAGTTKPSAKQVIDLLELRSPAVPDSERD
jgi:hypothetical protein